MRCPYCGTEIESLNTIFIEDLPAAQQVSRKLAGGALNADKEACPECGKYMYIRRHPVSKEVHLLVREDALSLDSARLANMYLNISPDPFTKYLKRSEKTGKPVAHVVWTALDRKRLIAEKTGDLNIASKLYLEKARYRCGIDKPFFSLQQKGLRYQLLAFKKEGAASVRVVSGHDGMVCSKCAEHQGAVYTIEEALETMPLPVKCDTSSRKVHIEDDHGWCRCFYVRKS